MKSIQVINKVGIVVASFFAAIFLTFAFSSTAQATSQCGWDVVSEKYVCIGNGGGVGVGGDEGGGIGNPGGGGNQGGGPSEGDETWRTYYRESYVGASYTAAADRAITGEAGNDPWTAIWNRANEQCTGSETRILIGISFDSQIKQIFQNGGWRDKSPAETQMRRVDCVWEIVTIERQQCVVDVDISFNKNQPGSSTLASRNITTAYGRSKTYENCLASQNVQWNEGLLVSDFGRYSSVANARIETFERARHYNQHTGETRYENEGVVGGSLSNRSFRTYAQLTCAGAQTGASRSAVWSGSWTWTHTDCAPTNTNTPTTYQCTGLDNPSVNGVAGRSQTIYRDGDAHELQWTRPGVTGQNLVSVGNESSQRFRLLREGTPWKPVSEGKSVELTHRSGARLNSNGQATSWASSRLRDPWVLRAYWESDKNQPLVITPQYTWEATIRSQGVRIESIHPFTGEIVTSIVGGTPIEAQLECTGTPVTVDVVRATGR